MTSVYQTVIVPRAFAVRRQSLDVTLFLRTFDSNSKRLSNRRCTGRMLRPRKTLGRSADLKVKNETLFYTSAADLAYME
ncbi:hypothetical protein EVAR_100064_1 [Eumeta japonica]|uniref:Uncharacterized protein n=1 Tax=Eumeta variegata TaxID=151549 RepID=A0A4C2A2F9_EUMVA|nr:hypothetical protein EVAR_100064_1 [Eumeta japonica]